MTHLTIDEKTIRQLEKIAGNIKSAEVYLKNGDYDRAGKLYERARSYQKAIATYLSSSNDELSERAFGLALKIHDAETAKEILLKLKEKNLSDESKVREERTQAEENYSGSVGTALHIWSQEERVELSKERIARLEGMLISTAGGVK